MITNEQLRELLFDDENVYENLFGYDEEKFLKKMKFVSSLA